VTTNYPLAPEEMCDAEYHPALLAARQRMFRYDRDRERREHRALINRLSRIGLSDRDIAERVGMSDRQVLRIRHMQAAAENRPLLPNPPLITDSRCRELERTAGLVLRLATLLRDEDPVLVNHTLKQLPRTKLEELATVALAAIPLDSTVGELFAWVTDLATEEVAS
jgi:hypothetical protein